MEEILFRETTTLGIRRYPVSRHKLKRQAAEVETPFGPVRGKLGWLDEPARRRSAPSTTTAPGSPPRSGVALREVYDAAHAAYQARQPRPGRPTAGTSTTATMHAEHAIRMPSDPPVECPAEDRHAASRVGTDRHPTIQGRIRRCHAPTGSSAAPDRGLSVLVCAWPAIAIVVVVSLRTLEPRPVERDRASGSTICWPSRDRHPERLATGGRTRPSGRRDGPPDACARPPATAPSRRLAAGRIPPSRARWPARP